MRGRGPGDFAFWGFGIPVQNSRGFRGPGVENSGKSVSGGLESERIRWNLARGDPESSKSDKIQPKSNEIYRCPYVRVSVCPMNLGSGGRGFWEIQVRRAWERQEFNGIWPGVLGNIETWQNVAGNLCPYVRVTCDV